jgi:hypothetical protein
MVAELNPLRILTHLDRAAHREVLQNSPMAKVYGGQVFRVRLDDPPQPEEFDVDRASRRRRD